MNKYGPEASEELGKALHDYRHGDAFKSRKQAVAVGLSKARREGGKVPAARHMQHK